MVPVPGRRTISLGVAAVLAAGLLYVSLRGIEWRQVARIVTSASPARLGLLAVISTSTLLLRAYRWRVLLNAEGTVNLSTAFWATAAGYFGNNFLPARAGELIRVFMISAQSTLDKAYVLTTALSERVADAVALVIIVAVTLLTMPAPPGWLVRAARPFAILGLLAAFGIAVLPFLGQTARATIERAPLPDALRPKLIAAVEGILRGLRAFHDLRRFSGFLGLTILIWCLDAVATVVGGAALGFRIPLAVAFLLIAALGLGSALPSTPGYVGIYQFIAVTVLTPFGFSRTDAIAYILVAQASTYVLIGFWGSLGLLRYRRRERST